MPLSETVGAVLVTHNGARHLSKQLASIAAQTEPPVEVLWVDDRSTDATRSMVKVFFDSVPDIRLTPVAAPPAPRARFSRIAGNFAAAMRLAAARHLFVALCDQDDVWLPHRIAHQRRRIATTGALMTASDGWIIDDSGVRSMKTLRGQFPLADNWYTGTDADRLQSVLRQPMATGAASMVTAELIERALPIPPNWLHDRWLSLAAAADGRLDADPERTIEYRVFAAQVVGLSGLVGLAGWSRLRDTVRRPVVNARKVFDLSVRLRAMSSRELNAELRPARVARTYLR